MVFLLRFCKQFDQRFPVSQEHEFVKSLDDKFDVPLFCGSAAWLCTIIFHFYWYGFWSLHDQDLTDVIGAIKNLMLASCCVLVMMTVAARRCLALHLCPVNRECLSLVLLCLTQALQTVCIKWYLSAIVGEQQSHLWSHYGYPAEEHDFGWGRTEELQAVLILNVLITVGCVVMPIRSHVLWLLPVFGIGLFCSLTYVASTPWFETFPLIVGYLFLMSGFSLWGGFRKEAYLRKEWLAQHEVEKQMDISEKQRQGFSHLLNRLSDCLLLLGPDLTILEPCPNLAAMLMLGKKQIHGTPFSDYFASGCDLDPFVAAMGRDISESEPSGILPLHLKDAYCRDVQVHAYYTSFHAKDNSRYHIVGIVEAEERNLWGALPPNSPGLLETGKTGMGSSSSRGGSLSSGSGDSSVISLHSTSGDLGEVSVVLSGHSGHRVISCSPGFTALCGSSCGGLDFDDCLERSSDLVEFIDSHVQDFVEKHVFNDVVILRNMGSTCDYSVGAIAMDCITYTGMDAPFEQQFTVKLRLGSIRECRKAMQKKRTRHTPINVPVILHARGRDSGMTTV